MKISDFENYSHSLAKTGKKKDAEKKAAEKVPVINSIGQKAIDVSIAMIIRIISFYAIFRICMIGIPANVKQYLKESHSVHELAITARHYGIDILSVKCVIAAFCIGTAYYVIMASKFKNGTIGMRLTGLDIKNKKGEKPTILQAILWHHLRLIYPLCGLLALMVFVRSGITQTFAVLLLIATAFSDTPRMFFGIPSLDEKISGIKLFLKKQ